MRLLRAHGARGVVNESTVSIGHAAGSSPSPAVLWDSIWANQRRDVRGAVYLLGRLLDCAARYEELRGSV